MLFWRKRSQTERPLLVDGALVHFQVSERVLRHTRYISIVLFILGAALLVYPLTQSAFSSTFYPETCLGDWEYPSRAEGEPDGIGQNGEGAAQLTAPTADLFCSSFVGEVIENAPISSAYVRFSWHVGELPDSPDAATSSEDAPNFSDSGDGVADEPVSGGGTTDEPGEESALPEDAQDNEPSSDMTGDEEISDEGVVEEEPAPEPDVEPEGAPPSVPEEAPASEPSAFLGNQFAFVPRAYAQEVDTGEEETNPHDVLRVSYTLDGSTWEDLGTVQDEDWEGMLFPIPLSEWSDIEHFQILVQGINSERSVPVYIDAVRLYVLYKRTDELNPEEELFEEVAEPYVPPDAPPYIPEGVRILTKEFVVDPDATHRCSVEPLSIDFSATTTPEASVMLVHAPEGGREELEIGSLPYAIDVTFAGNHGYVYRPKASESVIPLAIDVGAEAQRGSFSIPILYSRNSSVTVCQINVIY